MKSVKPSAFFRDYKSLFFIIISVASNFLCFGADIDFTPRDYSIIPPSPTVSALMDNIQYPVDYSRGTPIINLPLYTLKCGKIEIPISLSYNSGGIRVDQKAGNAGLGWTLSFGASIGHTVFGAPDDAYKKDIIHGLWHLEASEQSFRQKLISKGSDYDPTSASHFKQHFAWQATEGNSYYEGKADLANDLFQLYGLGLSATFAVLPNMKIVKSSERPLKIGVFTKSNEWKDGGCDEYGFNI